MTTLYDRGTAWCAAKRAIHAGETITPASFLQSDRAAAWAEYVRCLWQEHRTATNDLDLAAGRPGLDLRLWRRSHSVLSRALGTPPFLLS